MEAQAAAHPATPETTFSVVGQEAEARVQFSLKRFEEAIQSVLDTPLDAARVLEWTSLRAVSLTR